MHWTDRIGRRLNPHDLHIFMAVVEQGNMARAADSLAISRPVVSRTIAGLEQALGVRLLDRSPQGVEPTLYGRALLKRSVAVFDELKQSVRDIESLGDPNAGEVRIGCTEPMAAGFVSAVIDRLSRQYPQLVFQLELCTTPAQQFHVLRERKCDLVVARLWTQAGEPDLDVEILFDDQVFVVAGERNKWLGRRKVALAELVDEHWLLAPVDSDPGSPVFAIFRALGLEVPRAAGRELFPERAHQPVGHRAFSRHHPGFGAALRHHPERAQDIALQPAAFGPAGRRHHPQEPDAQPDREAVHRKRARGGRPRGQDQAARGGQAAPQRVGRRPRRLPSPPAAPSLTVGTRHDRH